MNERYFLTPRNSLAKDGLEAFAQGHKAGLEAFAQGHKAGLESLGQDLGKGAQGHKAGLEAFAQGHKAGLESLGQGLEVIGICWSVSVILGLGYISRRWPRNIRYVFVKTVNRNVSH